MHSITHILPYSGRHALRDRMGPESVFIARLYHLLWILASIELVVVEVKFRSSCRCMGFDHSCVLSPIPLPEIFLFRHLLGRYILCGAFFPQDHPPQCHLALNHTVGSSTWHKPVNLVLNHFLLLTRNCGRV